uniref:Uncharacterized protein n=1 Tax=Magallana gigas TaxID=29159 RepID=K1PST7_MAGGI
MFMFIPDFLNLRKTTTTAMTTIARVIPPAATLPVPARLQQCPGEDPAIVTSVPVLNILPPV